MIGIDHPALRLAVQEMFKTGSTRIEIDLPTVMLEMATGFAEREKVDLGFIMVLALNNYLVPRLMLQNSPRSKKGETQ